MFDHVKWVVHWTLLGAHVYTPMYYKVMTIYVCHIMYKKADAQEQMWLLMLALLTRWHGFKNANFKGFMVDSVQANFNAIRKIFGSDNKNIPMEGKERTC